MFLILLLDQALKIWVKLSFNYQESRNILGSWFQLVFIENEGMAYGIHFGGDWGKLALTIFRLIAVVWGVWFINKRLIGQRYHKGLIIFASFILAGALGNLIDSIFYGKIFSNSASVHVAKLMPWGEGYGKLFHGRVVDMLHFPLFEFNWPQWLPLIGGKHFLFFQPIFNVADSSIFIGVVTILLFQRRWIKKNAW